jgi:hypothetical protein
MLLVVSPIMLIVYTPTLVINFWYFFLWLPIYGVILILYPLARLLQLATPWWEIFNAVIKVIMVAGTKLMYEDSRRPLQIVTLSISLGLHLLVRPYKDQAGNIMVVYFCIVDLIAMHANDSMPLQITVFVLTLIALIILWSLFIHASRNASKEAKLKVDSGDSSSAMYGHLNGLERALLCPLLALMWPIKKLMALVRSKRRPKSSSSSSSSSATKVQPARQKSEVETVGEKTEKLKQLREQQVSQQIGGSEKNIEEDDDSDDDWDDDDEEYDPTTF